MNDKVSGTLDRLGFRVVCLSSLQASRRGPRVASYRAGFADLWASDSKWNKIEHPLLCHITTKWRGRALRTFETGVRLSGSARTKKGLRVRATLDRRKYPTGRRCLVVGRRFPAP